MDRHEKNADPQHEDGRHRDELERVRVNFTPSGAESTAMTMACAMERTPAANALPVMSAHWGVGVTISLVSTPASRSQTTGMPEKIAMNMVEWARTSGAR
jgi:hypothetical protein